jgi:glyoxylase-like metal-dependent hydrolase (beta-lactamase superfamily II)
MHYRLPHLLFSLGFAIALMSIALRTIAATPPDYPPWCDEREPGLETFDRLFQDEPWFEVYKVRENVYLFFEPRQFEHDSFYLIIGKKRALLFDTGLGIAPLKPLVKRITSLPVVVLNSHTHFDHVGGNHEFSNVWNMDSPYSRRNSQADMEPILAAYASQTLTPTHICQAAPVGPMSSVYRYQPYHVTHRVRDGEVIDLGGRKLKIIATPGHSPDSLCLLDVANRLLFTGDTFYPGPIFVWMPGSDIRSYEHSARKISLLVPDLSLLLPGHGGPVDTPSDLLYLADDAARVRRGEMPYTLADGNREFHFTKYSLVLPP